MQGSETILVKSKTIASYDAKNNPVFETKTITFKNCLVEYSSTSQAYDIDRNSTTTTLRIYIPTVAEINADDIIIHNNIEYVRAGYPSHWKSINGGWNLGTVVNVRNIDG